jgi:5'-methylthioadenosine phosphorylase
MNIKIGIIGGTGLGEALGTEGGRQQLIDTPFGKPSAPLLSTQWHGSEIAILPRHGIGHLLNPSQVPYRANLFALKAAGVTHILASGATGSLREHIGPGHLVIVDQVIDKTYRRANTFYERAAVHVELAEPFCPVMRSWLLEAASRADMIVRPNRCAPPDLAAEPEGAKVVLHAGGTYVCMEGPAFSTRAESKMHRAWGGDLIGMTVMPEARLAREAEIAYAMIAMPTDFDCWRRRPADGNPQALLEEIQANLATATQNNIRLMKAALGNVARLQQTASPAHSALALGVWSDRSRIDRAEVERLWPLWGKYFNPDCS